MRQDLSRTDRTSPRVLDMPWSAPTEIRLSDVLAGLSYALDLTEGQREGHSLRSCIVGMRIAETIGLSEDDRSASSTPCS